MNPTLTIGLPVYNAAPYLEEALRSILAQTFSDWELIAVDDGSSDDSARILRSFRDPRARVFVDGEHRGLAARLNQIVSQAAGQFVARMDADDLMHPERLARQVAFLRQHPEVDVVGCGLVSFDAELRPISVRHLPASHAEIADHPLSGFRLAHAATVSRREWWRKHPYHEQSRGCEDWELWFSSRGDSRFANLAELLYFYREEQAFSLARYVQEKIELAAVLRSKRDEFGFSAVLAAAAQWGRIAVYQAAHLAGAEGLLLRRRGTPPSEQERADFAAALEQVRSTRLPS